LIWAVGRAVPGARILEQVAEQRSGSTMKKKSIRPMNLWGSKVMTLGQSIA